MFTSLKRAVQVLNKDPLFAAVAIGSLAIGIGATSAMFSFGDAMLTRPLPVPAPSDIVSVSTATSTAFGTNTALSYPDYADLRDNNRTFAGLIASAYGSFGFRPDPSTLPRRKFGMFVSGNFFRVLGVEPSLGRGFRDDEDQAVGRNPVVVLGHDFWVSEFHANPSAVGSTIRLGGIGFTIIGVAPERFTSVDQFMRPTLFVPLAMSPRLGPENSLNRRDVRWLGVKGRLKPGVSLAQAQADISAITAQLRRAYPETNRNQRIDVQTELELRIRQSPPDAELVVMLDLLALCVLLVACANVAGLLLSRARARSREIAIRLAIGAGRWSLVRQLMVENLFLAIGGGLAGIGVAYADARYFNSLPFPTDLPLVFEVSVDQRMLLFTLAVSLLSTLFFGLAPALRVTRPDLVPALKGAEQETGHRHPWGRNILVSGQVCLSLVLLTVSVVLLQGFRGELLQGPGYRTDHLFLTSFDTQLARYSGDQTRRFYKELLDRVRSAPGIQSATLTSAVPMGFGNGSGAFSTNLVPEGYQLPPSEQNVTVFNAWITDGFFETMGIPILRGRGVLETDHAGAPLVAVVNEHFANHYWPKTDALGRRFHLNDASGPLVQIVGIAKTSKYFWIAEQPVDYIYMPYLQSGRSDLTLVTESTARDAATLAPVLRDVVHGLDPAMPVFDVRTMEDLYTNRAVKTPRLITWSVAGLGLMGLLLAIVGLYGLVAYSVSRRTREIGIRMAIGADRRQVMVMVLRQGFALGATGVAVGLVLSAFATHLVTSAFWVTNFSRINPLIYPALALPLLAVAVLAAWQPAAHASHIDPIQTLHEE